MPALSDIPLLPDDPIFSLPIRFAADTNPRKVNLGIGVYQDESGKPCVLSTVRRAEAILFDKQLGKNYLPIDGDPDYIRETLKLIFGDATPLLNENRVFGVQTVGGASALRVGAEFLATLVNKKLFLSDPTWINHINIFKRAGMEVNSYPYYNFDKRVLDFSALCSAIQNMPSGSIILLQACGHNPTGVDPTLDQWKELSALIKKQKLIPFFDLAYQGFCKGFNEDASAIRLFAEENHDMLVAYSFSKNMGLYGERVGALALVSSTADISKNAASQIRQMIRGIYSTPPLHGGRIAATILRDDDLRHDWLREVKDMRDRLHLRRQQLADHLEAHSNRIDFQFLDTQQGMFSFCGLSPQHVQTLINKFAIYLPADGRINVAGLNLHNLEYVSQSILEAMGS